jgi:GxxExxY protein
MIDLDNYRTSLKHIIGKAFEVYNELGGGLLESAYETVLVYLLKQDNFLVENQKDLPLWYKGVKMEKTYRMDIVLNGQIILELKSTEHIEKQHRLQLFNYLRLTRMPIGLLLNFTLDQGVHFEKYYFDVEQNRCIAFK